MSHIFTVDLTARDIISDGSRKASKKYRGSEPRQRREASTRRALAATPFQEARTHFAETLDRAPRRSSPHTSSPRIALESWVTSPRSTTTVRSPDGKSSGIFAREKYLAASRNFAVASAVASDPPRRLRPFSRTLGGEISSRFVSRGLSRALRVSTRPRDPPRLESRSRPSWTLFADVRVVFPEPSPRAEQYNKAHNIHARPLDELMNHGELDGKARSPRSSIDGGKRLSIDEQRARRSIDLSTKKTTIGKLYATDCNVAHEIEDQGISGLI